MRTRSFFLSCISPSAPVTHVTAYTSPGLVYNRGRTTEMSVERFHPGECGLPPSKEPENPEDVTIHCIQSSEFVLGKQDNFNGPVTIINCVERTATSEDSNDQMKDERIIIRDKVLSKGTADGEGNAKSDGAPEEEGQWWKRCLKRLGKRARIVLCVCGVLVLVLVSLALYFGLRPGEEPQMIGTHCFYPKDLWGGKPARSSVEMKLPLPYVVVSHTVTTLCRDLKGCVPILKNMQEDHFRRDFADISYNFLIDSGGNIYEGRGWNKRNIMGRFVNGRSIDVGLIGDYSQKSNVPSAKLIDGLQQLLEYGLEKDKLSRNYTLLAASSVYATLSPGKNVYDVIKDWPHFSECQ